MYFVNTLTNIYSPPDDSTANLQFETAAELRDLIADIKAKM
ncbi:UvrB/UvrC motif-containing protein [Candidatus Saccharibacteria bacterium]|nr:MAG: UvrB/UvrC motif-containing protein [Candidatus Saccharibacteria bacterium]